MALNGTNDWAKLNGGYIDDISPEQQTGLVKLRQAIPDSDLEVARMPHETYDTLCLRYLRARKFDHEQTVQMLTESIAWRRETRPDLLREKTTEEVAGCSLDEMRAFYPFGFGKCHDKFGHPLYAERTGQVDVDAMLIITDHDRLVQNHIRQVEVEQVQAFAFGTKSAKRPFPVDQVVAILDLNGLSMSQISSTVLNYVKAVSGVDQLRYPEQMYKTFVINAPGIFSIAWKVIRKFLDERTVKKIHITSGGAKTELLELFDADQLPVEFGGNFRVEGGFFAPSRTHPITVPRGSLVTETVEVDGTLPVAIKFFVRGGSMLYNLKFKPADGSAVVDIHVKKEVPDRTVIRDELKPTAPGTYLVELNNKPGWKQRIAYFRYDEIKPPSADESKTAEGDAPKADAADGTAGAGAGAGAGAAGSAGAGAGAGTSGGDAPAAAADAATPEEPSA